MDFAKFAEDLLKDRQGEGTAEPIYWVVLEENPEPRRLSQRITHEYLKESQDPPALNIASWQDEQALGLMCIRPWASPLTLEQVKKSLVDTPSPGVESWRCELVDLGDGKALLMSTQLKITRDSNLPSSDEEGLSRLARKVVTLVDLALDSLSPSGAKES